MSLSKEKERNLKKIKFTFFSTKDTKILPFLVEHYPIKMDIINYYPVKMDIISYHPIKMNIINYHSITHK